MNFKRLSIAIFSLLIMSTKSYSADYSLATLSDTKIEEIEDKVSEAKGKFQRECAAAAVGGMIAIEFVNGSVDVADSGPTAILTLSNFIGPVSIVGVPNLVGNITGLNGSGSAKFAGGNASMPDAFVKEVKLNYTPPNGGACTNPCSSQLSVLSSEIQAAWSGVLAIPSIPPSTPICDSLNNNSGLDPGTVTTGNNVSVPIPSVSINSPDKRNYRGY